MILDIDFSFFLLLCFDDYSANEGGDDGQITEHSCLSRKDPELDHGLVCTNHVTSYHNIISTLFV